jgi:hypothetical protein
VEELQRIGIGTNGSSWSLCKGGERGGMASVTLFNQRQKPEQKTLQAKTNARDSNGSPPMWIASLIRELKGLEVGFLYIVIEDRSRQEASSRNKANQDYI